VNKIKERPNYDIADGENLILSDCGFEDIEWKNCNFFADYDTYNLLTSKFNSSIIECCLLKVL
jgi:hypothetical protein